MASRTRRRRKDQPWNPPASGPDISTVFVLFAAGPLLLPVIGANADAVAFAVALVISAYAAVRSFGASRRAGERRVAWLTLAAATSMATLASLAGVATLVGAPEGLAFRLGALASLGLLAGIVPMARQALSRVDTERALDPLLMGLVLVGAGVYFVVVPGFAHGDAILTMVAVADFAAVLAAALAMVASRGARRRMTAGLLASFLTISAADALVALAAAGTLAAPAWLTVGLWATGSLALAAAAAFETGRPAEPAPVSGDSRWVYVRVLAPLMAVLAFPLIGGVVWLAGGLEHWAVLYFGLTSVLLLLLAFGRQARLLIENRTAMTRERSLREEVMRRNEDLEAVTGLATTMTQTLEEVPIIERGLEVLHLAARATSSALESAESDELLACAGDWQREQAWIDRDPELAEAAVSRRGGREIVQLPLAARGNPIGLVTVIRPETEPFTDSEVGLLRVLGGQLAIAIQNARDYREKLEQAVRDPLTGLYNRRYFFEALEQEVHRAQRYGSHAALVIFDVDDFKQINDTLGHSAGDEVLRRIADMVSELIREVDIFARIGGEEFALLLPQARPLDALLVADRIRTAICQAEILPSRPVTLSGGISACPQDGATRETLERKADAALYWAKRNGKNICALSSDATEESTVADGDGMVAHLTALISMVDAGAREASEKVASCAVATATELGLDADRSVRLRRAALLRDVGRIGVPASILEKPGPLEPQEYEQVQAHPAISAAMLSHAGLAEEALWVRSHHERIDGFGYPDGLARDEIPVESRILFVAEAFEAMTADRSYRKGITPEEAIEELREYAGTQFDEQVVEALARVIEGKRIAALAAGSD